MAEEELVVPEDWRENSSYDQTSWSTFVSGRKVQEMREIEAACDFAVRVEGILSRNNSAIRELVEGELYKICEEYGMYHSGVPIDSLFYNVLCGYWKLFQTLTCDGALIFG